MPHSEQNLAPAWFRWPHDGHALTGQAYGGYPCHAHPANHPPAPGSSPATNARPGSSPACPTPALPGRLLLSASDPAGVLLRWVKAMRWKDPSACGRLPQPPASASGTPTSGSATSSSPVPLPPAAPPFGRRNQGDGTAANHYALNWPICVRRSPELSARPGMQSRRYAREVTIQQRIVRNAASSSLRWLPVDLTRGPSAASCRPRPQLASVTSASRSIGPPQPGRRAFEPARLDRSGVVPLHGAEPAASATPSWGRPCRVIFSAIGNIGRLPGRAQWGSPREA